MRHDHNSRLARVRLQQLPRSVATVVIAVLVALAGLPLAAPAAAQAADPGVIGRRADTAAVSCWDIKQRDPGAPSGAYWLLTPSLPAPEQFHCDMTTDGGGWVLVGRGREGWNFTYDGQGTVAQVRSAVDGPDAFTPAALPAPVVDGLLDGARVDSLTDGIRLRRAIDTDGSERQEVRMHLARRDRWVWSFGAEHPLATWRFDGVSGSGGVTGSFGADQARNHVLTHQQPELGWRAGWAFGIQVPGTDAAGSYLWSLGGRGFAMPFTQVWLRPRLHPGNVSFPALPAGGTAAQAQRAVLSNEAETPTWGVTGSGDGSTDEFSSEVQAFAETRGRMVVGGNFRYVQRDGAGAGRVEQPFLAAFDVATREWRSDFRPRLNGQVKDIAVRPDGTIVAAGSFTEVNGAPAVGIVALDPVTGATVDSFRVAIENRLGGGGPVEVRTLDAQGDWLYLGGHFTHLAGGTTTGAVYARMAARVRIGDGTPDGGWNPEAAAAVNDLDASDRGDRVYLAGYFGTVKGVDTGPMAVVDTTDGDVVPGLQARFSNERARFQHAVREVGDHVWHGGAEHLLFGYRRSDFAPISGNITKNGGDFQTITARDGVVYGGCHCGDWNYQHTYSWRNLGDGWTQGDNIRYVGAWDAANGAYLPEFVPGLNTARGHGPWAMATDSTGATWIGGDLVQARTAAGWRWIGGFATYRLRDHQAPSRPGSFTATADGTTTTLTWGAANDDRGVTRYEVLRADRVVATTTALRLSLPSLDGNVRYAVRAVDRAGNRSASTVPVTVDGSAPPPPAFPDIAGNVHAEAIEAVHAAGIAQGFDDGTFRPLVDVTRGQMATFLAKALGLPTTGRGAFPDIGGNVHEGAITAIRDAGIAGGFPDGNYRPGATVSRQQMATFLANALDLPPGSETFPDVGGVHAANISAIATAGITGGYPDGTYRPANPVTRGQMATFIRNGFLR